MIGSDTAEIAGRTSDSRLVTECDHPDRDPRRSMARLGWVVLMGTMLLTATLAMFVFRPLHLRIGNWHLRSDYTRYATEVDPATAVRTGPGLPDGLEWSCGGWGAGLRAGSRYGYYRLSVQRW